MALALLLAMSAPARAQLEPQPTQFEQEQPASQPRLTRPPELIERHEPIYPPAAMQEGRAGEVLLQIEIGADGRVHDVKVTKSAAPDLDQAAIDAALLLVFVPAEWDGAPGPIIIEYRQLFELDERVAEPAAELPINFEGVVREAGSKDALEGVEVSIATRTALTDRAGRFFFRGIPAGRHSVVFALTGYATLTTDETFARDELTRIKVHLVKRVTNKFTTVVRERRAQKEVAKVALSRDEVSKIPGTFGDPLRVVENLPGMARASGIGGALIVRGANPEDTGVYFDGVQVPLLYHFGGLKSIVNPEFLEQIAFYPGGFGARYGRATAGIVDVSSRELRMPRFHGSADVGVMDAGFFFGGPVTLTEQVPTVTVAIAARRSYVDKLLPVVLDALTSDELSIMASPVYWDYQVKAETRPWPGQRFSIFGFGSSDDIRVLGHAGTDRLSLGVQQTFHRLVARLDSQLDATLGNTLQPFVGLDRTALELQANATEIGLSLGTYSWGVRNELQWEPLAQAQFVYGLEYQGGRAMVDFNVPVPVAIEVGGYPRIYQRNFSEPLVMSSTVFNHHLAFYLEAVLEPWPWLKVVPGLRLELLRYSYSDPVQQVDIARTDPRLALRFTPIAGTVLKGALGLYRQPPSSDVLSANPFLRPPRALQAIAGFEHRLLPQLFLEVQLYTTRRDLLVQSRREASIINSRDYATTRLDNGGWGNTVGAELMLRHDVRSYSLSGLRDGYRALLPGLYPEFFNSLFTEIGFFGWIAYTLSRTEIDLDPAADALQLTEFDQTHILTVVAQANLPLGFTFGARFRLVTGNPTTLPSGSFHDLDYNEYVEFVSSTPTRSPTFHQLDLRLDRTFVFDNFSLTPYLDVLNVYNQTNAEGYFTDYRGTTREPLPGLPILPNLGIKGEF